MVSYSEIGQRPPEIDASAWIAPGAHVIGSVELGAGASVWFGAVLRGDVAPITIGAETNIQDLCVLHATGGVSETTIGRRVTVGHRAIVHGATVEDDCLIGMGAILLDNVHVESDCLIAAGALIPPGTRIPRGSVVMGSPGAIKRQVSDADRQLFRASAAHYAELAARYARSAQAIPSP